MASSICHHNELSVLIIQLINIDEILGKYGKKITSQIIISIAKNLKKFLRKEETLAHLGGGRFSVLLPITSAFKTNIVAMRFQKTVANLAFKTGSTIIRSKLAAGLNSTDSYEKNVNFNTLYSDTEAALSKSLQSPSLKIVRYDESHKYDSEYQNSMLASIVTSVSDLHTNTEGSESKLNGVDFKRYVTAIFNAQYDQIPKHDIELMVEPLELFLSYVDEQAQLVKA